MRARSQPDYGSGVRRRALALLVLLVGLLSAVGGALTGLQARAVVPHLSVSLVGPVPRGFWYLSRTSGIVAFVLIWLSMALGLLITNKLARVWPGGPGAYDFHQHLSLLGIGFSLFHVLILLGDPQINMKLSPLLIPFVGFSYRPFWLGLGQVGLYLALVVALSFYARRWIGKKTWRTLHYTSFLVFVMVLLHSFFSGPASDLLWTRGLYWFAAGSILFLVVYRVWVARIHPPRLSRAKS